MPDAVFPPSITRGPRADTLSESAAPGVIRSETEVGPGKVRPRTIAVPVRFSIALDLTASQVTTLQDFFRITLAMGALPFTWTHPRTGATNTRFRFIEPPTITPLGSRAVGWWRATFELEQIP